MYPFDRAREKAVEIRKELLGERACEAVHVTSFLTPEIIEEKLELGVAFVPKGSTDLGDADAILRRSENYIYVRDDVSDPETAHLVTHELGHYVLDEGLQETSIASLKSLVAAEGSPAVIKVEAYGARERLELRANVFARELQLPRSVARKLFLDGFGPRTVAADYGIHLEVVRQQMLDAVMLPPTAASSESKAPPLPSSDQVDAIRATERFVNVVAGPGSGKTTTLVHRVRYLIEEMGVDPSQILILTFTNKAAFELIERLRDAGIAKAADVWAGTFHAFGLEFLRKYHQCFGLDSDVLVADKLNSITLLNRQLPTLDLKHYKRVQDPYEWLPTVVAGISRLKEEMVDPQEYRNSLQGLPTHSEAVRLQREDVAALYECHERILEEKGLVDFVDLISKPAMAMKEDRAQYGEIADRFQYVLVDEYQDVTFAMVELIKQIAKNAKSLWVVGDVRQAIHHWRGASVKSLLRFDQTFKSHASTSLRTYPLKYNRRSSSEIVEVVQQVGRRHVLQETALKLADTTATAGKTGDIPIVVQCQPEVMAEAVAEHVQGLHKKGVPHGKQAVLSRGNHDVQLIAAYLWEKGIPVLYIGEPAQRREVKNLLCLMQLLVERGPRALVGLMGEAALRVGLDDLHLLMEACADDPLLQRGGWRYKVPEGLTTESRGALAIICGLLQGQRRRSSPWSFICDILLERRFGYPDLSDDSIDAHAIRIALWQFTYATRAGDGEGKIPTLPRFLLRQQLRHRIGEMYSDRELPAEVAGVDAVHMLTVHGSKGLEFEAVHLVNVNIDDYGPAAAEWRGEPATLTIVPPEALRSTRQQWDFEAAVERNNLLYVAVSRPRRYLRIYESEEQNKRAPQLLQVPAPYRTARFIGSPMPKLTMPPPPAYLGTGPMPFNEFETYARCPLQHWYRHVLNLPGEQQKDIAIRAHIAIMDAVQRIGIHSAQNKNALFAAVWQQHKLPSETEDGQLWNHAVEVFSVGADIIEASRGSYAEPVTDLNGFQIRLPWLLLENNGRKVSIEYLRFSGGLDAALKLWRPMLNGLRPVHADDITMYCLLDGHLKKERPSQRITSTKAYSAVQKLRVGDRQPNTGKHCNWCPYSTFCPTFPY